MSKTIKTLSPLTVLTFQYADMSANAADLGANVAIAYALEAQSKGGTAQNVKDAQGGFLGLMVQRATDKNTAIPDGKSWAVKAPSAAIRALVESYDQALIAANALDCTLESKIASVRAAIGLRDGQGLATFAKLRTASGKTRESLGTAKRRKEAEEQAAMQAASNAASVPADIRESVSKAVELLLSNMDAIETGKAESLATNLAGLLHARTNAAKLAKNAVKAANESRQAA